MKRHLIPLLALAAMVLAPPGAIAAARSDDASFLKMNLSVAPLAARPKTEPNRLLRSTEHTRRAEMRIMRR